MRAILSALFLLAMAFATESRASSVFIMIDLQSQTMSVDSEEPYASYEWKVSTGMKGHRTPGGTYEPKWLSRMHYSSIYESAPMPHSIFFKGGYAIHGTYDVKHLGRPVSHGCVRLSPRNAKILYELVEQVGLSNVMINIVP